jgi:hypothetical protein
MKTRDLEKKRMDFQHRTQFLLDANMAYIARVVDFFLLGRLERKLPSEPRASASIVYAGEAHIAWLRSFLPQLGYTMTHHKEHSAVYKHSVSIMDMPVPWFAPATV